MSNPTTEPKQTWEKDFESFLFDLEVSSMTVVTMPEREKLKSFISANFEAERERGKEIAYKNVGGWHKLPLLNSDHQGRCPTCGHAGIHIRGKHPHYDNREICPLCAFEALENILDSCNNRQSYQENVEESTL